MKKPSLALQIRISFPLFFCAMLICLHVSAQNTSVQNVPVKNAPEPPGASATQNQSEPQDPSATQNPVTSSNPSAALPRAETLNDSDVETESIQKKGKYLVLQNGSILFGDLTLIGDKYELTTRNGTIFLPQENVVQIAENMEQIYAYRASLVFINDVQGRCDLVNWCFQHEMLDKARTQLDLLRKYAPEHPLLDVFERRMEFLQKRQTDALASRSPSELTSESNPNSESDSISSFPVVRRPPMAELERMADSLPQDAIESFRKKIQPILQKNCMAIGCHGPDSQNAFRLLRISPQMARGELLQNLSATLQQINLTRPELSPFLRKPATPHGLDSRIIFANQDYATYQLLIGWTYLVAQNRYVIPKARLLPPTGGAPVFTPTSRGLLRISQNSGQSSGPCDMWGVDPSLYPQALYPAEYAAQPPTAQEPAQNAQCAQTAQTVLTAPNPRSGAAPKFRMVFPENPQEPNVAQNQEQTETDDPAWLAELPNAVPQHDAPQHDDQVRPASGETSPMDAEPIVPVSAEEEKFPPSASKSTPTSDRKNASQSTRSNAGNTDWAALRQAISLGVGDAPENDASGNDAANPDSNQAQTPAFESIPQQNATNFSENLVPATSSAQNPAQNPVQALPEEPATDWDDLSASFAPSAQFAPSAPQIYAPGQNTNENPLYRPGQSSVSEIHIPGKSSASNLQRGNPGMGMTGSPIALPAPQSPASLLHGRDSVQRSNGSYHYDANAKTRGPASSQGSLQWEQMLEMQGGVESLKK